MRKIGLKGVVKVFSVDYNTIDVNGILDIHRNLMKETYYKIIFRFIKKVFVGLLRICPLGSLGALLAFN